MQRLRTVTSLDVSAVAGHHVMPAALLFESCYDSCFLPWIMTKLSAQRGCSEWKQFSHSFLSEQLLTPIERGCKMIVTELVSLKVYPFTFTAVPSGLFSKAFLILN